jgi:excinuclease ABC subunit C
VSAALKDRLSRLPDKPGIYFFKNSRNEIIYIGKARSLRDRVRSYFLENADQKVQAIVADTDEVDFILTGSEKEAAFLENNYIQRYQPKFNLRLKDDKSFPYLKISLADRFPGVFFSRRVEPDGSRYFGPYVPAQQARRTIRLLNRFFGLRGCEEAVFKNRRRPCLEYDLGYCSAPCVGLFPEEEYARNTTNALLFLEGRDKELLPILKNKMKEAARRQAFEQAALWRDLVRTLEEQRLKPRFISAGREDKDIVGLSRRGGEAAVHVFLMRKGKVSDSEEQAYRSAGKKEDSRLLAQFLKDFYSGGRTPPETVLLPSPPEGLSGLERDLSRLKGKKVRLLVPERGGNRGLVDLAVRNAEKLLAARGEAQASPVLEELKSALGLKAVPLHIEGFDVSNTGGTETVGSSVSFLDGRPQKDEYRKYRVKTVAGPNDVASLKEIVGRRLARLKEESRLPDLILVDGGRGQLRAAGEALAGLDLAGLPLASLAKKNEIVYSPAHREGLALPRTSPALKLLQHIRDEAHRFAVSFHRKRRTVRSFGSWLDGVPGLGPKKRKALLAEFKSLEQIKSLNDEELARRIGRGPARFLKEKL